MFWTDHHKNNAHIGRANMDGSDQKHIVSTDVIWPNGLAVDYAGGCSSVLECRVLISEAKWEL